MAKNKNPTRKYLIFIDTNIFLDFYRDRSLYSSDIDSLLDKLIFNKEIIITSDQVEMEFFKNRQSVIHDTFSKFRELDWGKVKLPNIFENSTEQNGFKKTKEEVRKYRNRVFKKIDKMLVNPARHDKFFKKITTILENSSYRYSRDMSEKVIVNDGDVALRDQVYHKAKKRFLLGYPPRKNSDTSFGDALN